ncbi:MAG: hypothetical protein HFE73_09525 [Firmicutes bacterium]|jgi:hypothetical protein|nr:hypothetical protein [Bacillota bacterium]
MDQDQEKDLVQVDMPEETSAEMLEEKGQETVPSPDAELQEGERKERTPEQEAGRMRTIQAIVTTVAIIVIAFLVFTNWNDEEGYMLNIPTDDGYTWEYSLEGESQQLLSVTSAGMEEGKYVCKIDGLGEGKAEIHVKRVSEANPSEIVEERIYHVVIMEDGSIIQKAVDRVLHGD